MKTCPNCDNSMALEVGPLEAKVERLRCEIVWCHVGLTTAHEHINPEIPTPDWHIVFESLRAAKSAGEE